MRCFSVLGLALLAAASTAFAEIDHGLLNLVPQGTQVLAGFQVDEGKASALGQYLLQRAGSDLAILQDEWHREDANDD